MKLTWYGHSCFLMETEGGSVVFDPYSPGSVPGVELPELSADLCFCSHEHGDHFYPQAVKLTKRATAVGVVQVPSFHDGEGGAKRGKNTITLIEADGLRAAHLGDLGHVLTEEQVQALGRVDVLMIPVGGFFTIDAKQAAQVVRQLKPRIVIPMHYKSADFGFDVISTVDEFLSLSENVRFFDTNTIDLSAVAGPLTAVLKCPVKA